MTPLVFPFWVQPTAIAIALCFTVSCFIELARLATARRNSTKLDTLMWQVKVLTDMVTAMQPRTERPGDLFAPSIPTVKTPDHV